MFARLLSWLRSISHVAFASDDAEPLEHFDKTRLKHNTTPTQADSPQTNDSTRAREGLKKRLQAIAQWRKNLLSSTFSKTTDPTVPTRLNYLLRFSSRRTHPTYCATKERNLARELWFLLIFSFVKDSRRLQPQHWDVKPLSSRLICLVLEISI